MPSIRKGVSMAVLFLGAALFVSTSSSLEVRNKLMRNLGARSLASTHTDALLIDPLENAQTTISKEAHYFEKLRRQFAQQSATEEQAYLEIAKKLMKLSDVLPELQACMD